MKRFIPLVLLLNAACGSGTVTNPSSATAPMNLAGSWVGSTSSSVAGTGSIDATIAQSGPALSGVWSVRYANPFYNNNGSVSGSLLNNTVSLSLSSNITTPCPYSMSGTLGTGMSGTLTITGTFTTVNCTPAQSGAFTLSRQ